MVVDEADIAHHLSVFQAGSNEHGAKRNFQISRSVAKHSVQYLTRALFGGMNPSPPPIRIDHPNNRNAELQIVINLVLHVAGAVFR